MRKAWHESCSYQGVIAARQSWLPAVCFPPVRRKPGLGWRREARMNVSLESIAVDRLSLSCPVRQPLSVKDLIGRYHGALLNFLRQRLRVADDAADVAQEAYIRMMQYEGSREVQSPSSLLFRVATNLANDLGRSEQVRRAADHCAV